MKNLNFLPLFAAVVTGFVLAVYSNLHLDKFLDGTLGDSELIIYAATIVVLGLFAPLYYLFLTGSAYTHDTVINGRAIAFLVTYVWYCVIGVVSFALLYGALGIEIGGIVIFSCYAIHFASGIAMIMTLSRYQARVKELREAAS